jgi:lysozyme
MPVFNQALDIIKTYEGFNERAYPDPNTGAEPYTIGYGTQFYPDGSPVKKGQCCSKAKALEYLLSEVKVINNQLTNLNIPIDDSMRQALISFIHSVGWEPFLYSNIIDAIENNNFYGVTAEINRWVFDADHNVIGGLMERRQKEIELFLQEINANPWCSTEVLLSAFRNYSAAPNQVRAIRKLEENINPYTLAEFANSFKIDSMDWIDYPSDEFDSLFNV